MSALSINYLTSPLSGILGWVRDSVSTQDQRLKRHALEIISKKEVLLENCLSDTRSRYHPITGTDTILIGGDVFSTGFLLFEGIQAAIPATAAIPAVIAASAVFGVVGGVINIAVGGICLKEGLQALQNKDYLKAGRLILDAVLITAIGAVMILATISVYVGFLGGVGAFLAANPWVLPVLFLVITLPLLVEILKDTQKIWRSTDTASSLQLHDIEQILESKTVDWNAILEKWKGTVLDVDSIREKYKEKGIASLSDRMEMLQMGMGPRAAIEAFKLFEAVLEKNETKAKASLKELKGHVAFLNKSLHVRLFQQVLLIASFVVSMLALKPKINPGPIVATQNFTMAVAMGIPVWMDAKWPFARNTPIIVPKVDVA